MLASVYFSYMLSSVHISVHILLLSCISIIPLVFPVYPERGSGNAGTVSSNVIFFMPSIGWVLSLDILFCDFIFLEGKLGWKASGSWENGHTKSPKMGVRGGGCISLEPPVFSKFLFLHTL